MGFLCVFGIVWQGCGENDFEAHAGVFWDRFRSFWTRRCDQKGYVWCCVDFLILCHLELALQFFVHFFHFFVNLIGKKIKGTKRYMPQRNSVAYALLITLYRYIPLHYRCIFFKTILFKLSWYNWFWLWVLTLILIEELQMGKSLCVNRNLLMLLKLVGYLECQLRMFNIVSLSLCLIKLLSITMSKKKRKN